jgi:glutamate/tyrosine decarboxylase-like PLP-dependent enzyme
MHKAAFLGPKAENADELERLLLEVLHDHAFWRRNFHPEDPRLIAEADKRTEAYGDAAARLRDELFQILAELKRGAPLFSPRQIGHMVSDPTLPALVGYFAGLLYNQNNVVAEASPETVRKERAFVAALARMIGYPALLPERLPPGARRDRTPFSWGHLASGGTSANIEALWVARNVRLYPLAVRLLVATNRAFAHLGELEVAPAGGRPRPIGELATFELLNLPVDEVTELHLRIRDGLAAQGREELAGYDAALPSVRRAGLAGLMSFYNDRFPADPLRPPVALVSQAAHYGWAKAMDVTGLGAVALRLLPVDARLRLDVGAMAEAAREAAGREEAVVMVVSICGTTEEGAVDPAHRIESVRRHLATEGIAFWHHADAAFGGYLAATLPRDADGRALPYDPTHPAIDGLLSEDVYRAVGALADVDSVTLDPHKWGYVPYPAGAVLFRDYHVRDAIGYAAPYLPTDEAAGFGGFLGRWTLEGSRPGAPAVSAYLSQAVLPLDPSGHGALVRNCLSATRGLLRGLERRFADGPVALRLLAEPDTVGFCFALVPRAGVRSLADLNAFTRRVWEHVNVDGRDDVSGYRFLLSKTEVPVDAYRHVLTGTLPASLVATSGGEAVMLLRVFVLNPFLAEWSSFADAFATYLGEVVGTVYPEHALRALTAAQEGRLRVLVAEEDPSAPGSLARALQQSLPSSAYVDVQACPLDPTELASALVATRVQRVVVEVPVGGEARAAGVLARAVALAPEEVLARVPAGSEGRLRDALGDMAVAVNIVARSGAEDDLRTLVTALAAPGVEKNVAASG